MKNLHTNFTNSSLHSISSLFKNINYIFLFFLFSNICTAQVDATSLLSHWTLDESNGSKVSDSVGNNQGALVNSPIWQPTQGHFDGALEFDGNDDRVDLGTLDIPGSQMSISFWFKADNFNESEARFISKATGTSGKKHYWMVSAIKKSKLRFRLKTKGSTTTLISKIGTISTNQWHHVTATYDGNKMKIYRDGELVASTAKTGKIDTNNNAPVAIGNQPANAGSRPFDGLIDDVRIYTVALNDSQIQSVIDVTPVQTDNETLEVSENDSSIQVDNETPVVTESEPSPVLSEIGLLSHWTLDESNGSKASDSLGNNPGALINSPVWRPTQGQLGGALEFDGSNDRVDLGILDIPGSEMSLSFWFKADNFDEPEARIISKARGTGSKDHYWMVGTYKNSSLRFRLKTNGTTTTLISSANVISTSQWHHVIATYNGNKMRIYRDGELVASTAKIGKIDTNNSVSVSIGNQPVNAGSRPFDGLIDEVRIYSTALAIDKIQALNSNTSLDQVAVTTEVSTEPELIEEVSAEPEPIEEVSIEPSITTDEDSYTTSDGNTGDGSVILDWTEPVARVDGTTLAATEIAGYTVYYGTSEGVYSDSFTMSADFDTSVTITDLQVGTYYYLAITTLDTDGLESVRSSIAKKLAQ